MAKRKVKPGTPRRKMNKITSAAVKYTSESLFMGCYPELPMAYVISCIARCVRNAKKSCKGGTCP